MNYYQHHIGDFIRDTARLSDSQCMAYIRMMWLYYETEAPLENDADAIAFKIGANASDVHQIFKHFFFLHDDGLWHQARCDKEILAFREKSNKAKKSADARWNNANAMRTHSERNANEPVSHANQEPVTSNQEPITTDQETLAVGDESPPAAAKSKIAKSFFDYETGRIENLSANIVASWQQAYPAIDIRIEIAKAKAWLLANPKNRKSNLEKFLTNWLNKAQDRAPRVNHENGRRSDTRQDTSAAGRVRAAVARAQAARAGTDRAGLDPDGLDVRPQVGEQLRGGGGPGQGMGSVLEGDFTRAD